MDAIRQRAYRYLLYHAMLDIRAIGWLRTRRLLNPFSFRSEISRIRCAGAVADWLHNLAFYSAHNFERFDESWFWSEHKSFIRRFPHGGLEYYRKVFDSVLEGIEGAPFV